MAFFETSPEFQSYLFSCPIYGETYTEEEMNRMYEEIQDIEIPEKPSLMQLFLKYWSLRTEKMIAEKAFWNYKEHLYEKDYISAMVDKNVFIHAWFDLNIIKHLTTLHDYFYTVKNYALYLGVQKYFFYDLVYLLFLTITIFTLFYLIFFRFMIRYLL